MGLPIFLLSAEADLPHKSTKLRSSSPPRTSIRRDDRERRQRRAVRLYGNAPHSRPEFGRPSPWAEPPTSAAQGSEPRSREVLREMSTRFDSRRRERIEEQMTSIFGNNWQEAGQPGDRYESDLGWWSLDGGRPRVPRPRHAPTPPLPAHVQALGVRAPRHPSPNDGHPSTRPALARVVIDVPQALGTNQTQQPSINQRRTNPNHDPTMLDGLGDRQRSVSPAEWDTLLTTLTPDPQPPSANSSFASGPSNSGPSQASGSTSATTLPSQSLLTGEDHCEPGWENSDAEESTLLRPDRRRRAAPGASFNADSGSDAPAIFGIRVHRGDRDAIGRPVNREPVETRTEMLRAAAGERQGDAWVGRALIGAAESRDGDNSRRRTRENSSGANTNGGQGDEDFSGMQHIVRGLASRDDIPDEWWAEVGLSRTLPQEGGN